VRVSTILATNVVDGTVFAYAYDDIGNRLWSREFGTNCTYVANELNQYTNIVRGGVAEHPTFDADGNQTDIVTETGRWRVEYNGENRPVRWTRPADGMVLEMAYDSRGRRVRFNADTFVYDGYLNVGTTVWDPTEPIATRPLAWLAGDGPAYYFHDGNKNVTDVVAESEAARYSYAPFGKSEAEGALADWNPYRFSSEVHDGILDLTYYNYRQFAPQTGRWMTYDLQEEDISYYADVLADLERTPFELYLFLDNAPVTNEERLGLGQVGSPIRCGNCLICIDNDTSSGDGNGYKIHWNCGKHGRASTCRGGLSAQWPSGLPSHGNLAKVPPSIRKCLKGTRWELKELPVSIPASKPNCCRRSVIYAAEPSDGGTLVGTPEMATVSLCLGAFMVVIAIVLLPVGI